MCITLAWSAASGCRERGGDSRPPDESLKFWHTFDTTETEALNELLSQRERAGAAPVEVTRLPFARAMTILADVLAAGERCPDLVRIDATWLPGLAERELLVPAPAKAAGERDWLPEAIEMARYGDRLLALPQAIDGLALIHHKGVFEGAAIAWPPATVGELELAATRLRHEARYGLGLRADGYWYIPFLRGLGGRFSDLEGGMLHIDEPVAVEALARMGELFARGVAPSPAAGGEQGSELARQFRRGEMAVVLEGPWLARELAGDEGLESLGVTPFPDGGGRGAAPRGAQLLAVPTCAAARDEAWKLARELTAPELQAAWGRTLGTVPATRTALAESGELAEAFYRAFARATPLPRHPVTAELFDDLTPAVRAVAHGDATAEEALAGVRRSWHRLAKRHGYELAPRAPQPRDAGADAP